MRAGKHVLMEIPIAADRGETPKPREDRVQKRLASWHGGPHATLQSRASMDPRTHRTRRAQDPPDGRADLFLPPYEHERAGQPRTWTDHLFGTTPRTRSTSSTTRRARRRRNATPCEGRPTRRSASPWTWAIHDQRPSGAILTLSLSFNNDGPLGTVLPLHLRQRHVHCALRRSRPPARKRGRCLRRRRLDERHRTRRPRVHYRHPEKRQPNSSVEQVLPCMRVMGKIEKMIDPKRECVV